MKKRQKSLSGEMMRNLAEKTGGHVCTSFEMLDALKEGYCVWGCDILRQRPTIKALYNLTPGPDMDDGMVECFKVSAEGAYEVVMICVLPIDNLNEFVNACYALHDFFIIDYNHFLF